MSEASCVSNTSANIYDEKLNSETLCDCSSQGLTDVPKLENQLLSVIYLQNNQLIALPDDFFPSLPSLMYLDLRNNLLSEIPKTVKNHRALTHLLLQNNNLTSLPKELGTVVTLKVLQLNGNPLKFPPKEILSAGISKIKKFLSDKLETVIIRPATDFSEGASDKEDTVSYSDVLVSYNSFADVGKTNKNDVIVQFNEKEDSDEKDEFNGRLIRKCPKLAKSRRQILPSYLQSSKYVSLGPVKADSKDVHENKIKAAYLKGLAVKKRKELLEMNDKILQERKNVETLKNWRRHYLCSKSVADQNYRLVEFPYGTNSEYMTLLTRADIEKDLPDKYRRKLIRKTKPSVPRRANNDVQLAIKIKQLFQNLEAIDLNRAGMTPRTEQNILRNEIKKKKCSTPLKKFSLQKTSSKSVHPVKSSEITEIKEKLKELSTNNINSVIAD